ncbi:MAG: heterodisulfide reductase, subunit B [Deltaproteobacteria bacterium]|nr:heterodisulfide reductase, subunit B [Deltaproteobacteria bacterium]
MKVSYYPGCTLKSQARPLEEAARAAMARLGVELAELPRWNCCGVVHPLAADELMGHVAAVRNLVRAQEAGDGPLVTLCAMCYNTLARANRLMREQPDKLAVLNSFMDEEPDYQGGVRVEHLLGFLAREVGWEAVARQVRRPLTGWRVAAYYGCKLQRPREVAVEPPGSFQLLGGLLRALGATVVNFPATDLCCGSYQVLAEPALARELSSRILTRAGEAGAELLALSCPLCHYNLSRAAATGDPAGARPVYFTELLAWAFGEKEALEASWRPGPAREEGGHGRSADSPA